MKLRTLAILAVGGLVGLSARAPAHDFWIEPGSFAPRSGAAITVALRVGEDFAGEKMPRTRARIVKFADWGPSGEVDIPGQEGIDPAGLLRVERPGWHVLGYRSNHARVELEAAKFEKYLKEEGLERIIELRRQRGENGKPAREAYSRAAKCLIHVDGAGSTGWERETGFALELVPEKAPSALAAGDELPVRLLFEGKPLEGALLTALEKSDPQGARVSVRSDADGRAKLRLARGGTWLIKSTHMVRAPKQLDADWESFWASLTFEVAGPPVAKASPAPAAP